MNIDSIISSTKPMRECLRERLEVVGGEKFNPQCTSAWVVF